MVRILLSDKLGEFRLNQKDLAKMTGIRPGTISDYYWGEATGMKFEHMEKLCAVFNCSLTDLIEITPDDPPKVHPAEPMQKPKRKKRHADNAHE